MGPHCKSLQVGMNYDDSKLIDQGSVRYTKIRSWPPNKIKQNKTQNHI